MKQALLITAACLFLAQNGAAYGETPHEGTVVSESAQAPVSDIASQSDELSERLDQILTQALDAKILRAPGEASETAEAEDLPESEEGHHPPVAQQADADFTCDSEYPLDFSEFSSISVYHDLDQFRDFVSPASEEPVTPPLNERLVKALLVLGLNSEALAILRHVDGSQAAAFRQLALLMEDRQRPDVDFFRQVSDCHDEAGLWLAVALLANDQEEGAALMSRHVAPYRKLPRHLRIDVAAMTVPALEALGEPTLARTLLSDFAPDEIENSPRLQFTKALLSMGEGSSSAEDTVRSFLAQAEFRIDALAALSRYGGSFSEAEKDVLLNEVERVLGHAEDERDIAVALRFSLNELSTTSDYSMMLKLAELPALQTIPAQKEIRRQFLADMKRDFSGDDAARKMAAVDALLSDSSFLRHLDGIETYYLQAAEFAGGAGYLGVSEQLLAKSGSVELADRARAEIAYRDGQNDVLFELTAEHPQDDTIALYAALAAVRAGDGERVRQYEDRLGARPDALLAVLEADAAEGQWVVSPAMYEAGAALEDEALKARAVRAMELRLAAQAKRSPDAPSRPSDIGAALMKSREAFRHLGKEAL